ncbi:MAG: phosphohistidine phosphatase SixA [Acidobacteria bacterium]|nr:phosphohistidine phosphatase SixA [Acidobacteriota bacterium]
MTIYLLRHGIAEPARPGAGDAGRALTDEGRKKLRAVLKLARGAGVRPKCVLSSPLVRAVQTAELAIEALGCETQAVQTAALSPAGAVEEVWNEIRAHKDAESVLLSGHEPQFSQLTAYLLDSPALAVDFKKGALVAVEVGHFGPHPRGVLRWMLAPKLAAG